MLMIKISYQDYSVPVLIQCSLLFVIAATDTYFKLLPVTITIFQPLIHCSGSPVKECRGYQKDLKKENEEWQVKNISGLI